MKVSRTAKRYAQAVFEIARDANDIDGWLTDLRRISDVVGVAEMATFLRNPEIDLRNKEQALAAVVPDIGPMTRNLLHMLTMRNKVEFIPSIHDEYERLVNSHRGRAEAEVTTAVPVEAAQREAIQKWLARFTGKEVIVKHLVDPSIIGGLIARVGDQIIDGSVRTRLESLKKNLLGIAA